jgi:hypothetical protein
LYAALKPEGTPAVFVHRRGTRTYTPVGALDVDAVADAVATAAKRVP